MRRYILIGLGGFLGAIARYILKNWSVLNISSRLPLTIIIINILGCFALAFFLKLAFEIWEVDTGIRLGIATGFIGAFTTFSTLCKEAMGLLLIGDVLLAIFYLALSIAAGFAAIYLGEVCAKRIIKLHEKIEDNSKISE